MSQDLEQRATGPRRVRPLRGALGLTLVELVASVALIALLGGLALPVAHTLERRSRELELRQRLREMRRAIDFYHATLQAFPQAKRDVSAGDWPEDLDVLVEGIDLGQAKEIKAKFLRRIPRDPLTGKDEWGKRSSKQEPNDDSWDGLNVFDVHSLAEGQALDGSAYREW